MAFAGILIIACNNPNKDAKENPYEGAWEQTYSKYVYPDSTLFEPIRPVFSTVKILTKKHFAFGNQAGQNQVYGGGGEYTFEGDTYIEHIKYHANPDFVDKSFKYKTTLEGDLWQISTVTKLGSIQVELTETWKRIIE